MIISASRRTDIPAFYSRWFVNRLSAGFADVVNPFNPNQVRRVDLTPAMVDAIILWTRNPKPLMKHLKQIDSMGYHYYFLYTVTNYPKELEPNLPSLAQAADTIKQLSDYVGPDKVIWRYDPIVYSSITDLNFHCQNIEHISRQLSGLTKKVIISFVDPYKKTMRRVNELIEKTGIKWYDKNDCTAKLIEIACKIKEIAWSNNIELQSCAEDLDLSAAGIQAGSCIDFDLINRLFGLNLKYKEDRHQRPKCMCSLSVDIGAYNTCGYRCVYCYANSSFETAARNLKEFDSNSSSMYNIQRRSIDK